MGDLAAGAHDQIAAPVLLHGLATLWTGLGVCSQPVLGLAVIMTLLPPLPPPAFRADFSKMCSSRGRYQVHFVTCDCTMNHEPTNECHAARMGLTQAPEDGRRRAHISQVQGEWGSSPQAKQKRTLQVHSGSQWTSPTTLTARPQWGTLGHQRTIALSWPRQQFKSVSAVLI